MQITRLKYERLQKGWTQQELADKVGVTKSTIQRIETLQRKPSYDVLIALRTLFNLHDGDLLQQISDDAPFSSTN
ncbi:MAG: helix-turn-helix transcriptional regulator [Eubacteriales bacterium]|nr:helix-turn-helix transcriptional regulator [Eubacteriales bacterium]